MKRQQQIPRIPGISIALVAMLLGIMVAPRFMPASDISSDSYLGRTAIGVLAIAVAALVVLKSQADRRSRTGLDLLEAFLENIPDNVFFKDRESRFIRISRAMANYCGLADPALASRKTDFDIFSSEHAHQALTDEEEIIRTGRPIIGVEEKETWPDGREGWVLTTKVPLRNHQGQIIGTMGIARDITDRKQAEARIHYMALHDALTGLPNRVLLQERLTQAIALANRNRNGVAVLMLDLDRFKNINDSLGHYIGDRLLEHVSTRLKACLRKSDIVARFGGDEFVFCLPAVTDTQGVERVAKKILTTLAEPFQIEGHELKIGASLGICQYPINGESPETLLQSADAAMYEAKTKGRGIYCFFTPELSEEAKRRQKLEKDLHKACARGEFILHYQPQVSAVSGRITGMEALLRWNHPEQGMISPNQFIPLLEELGLMVEVGQWVIRTACLQNVAWQNAGLPPIRMAVNVSAQQFHRGDIAGSVEAVLSETGLDPKWLELELTESLTLDESEVTIRIMHDLKRIGVGLSLDDFGTGWSSLSYLRRFPLDRLKIDRSFMRDIVSQPAAEAVVRSIMSLARNLGLTCVGEGVETRQQLEYLQKHMCPEVQGFLYSPALPAADCAQLLRAGKAKLSDAT
ncbi:MAG TPA: EAL domain-containing protein, partial [Acidobacteriaceae bacterium]|nr:EAL domain-containing protein [Acidobacteriaceae bacterium]